MLESTPGSSIMFTTGDKIYVGHAEVCVTLIFISIFLNFLLFLCHAMRIAFFSLSLPEFLDSEKHPHVIFF